MKKGSLAVLLLIVVLFVGCTSSQRGSEQENVTEEIEETVTQVRELSVETMKEEDLFSDRDLEVGTEDQAVSIFMEDGKISYQGQGVQVVGTTIILSQEGTYSFQGELKQGQILVEATKDDKIQIVLDGVTLTNQNAPVIWVKQADKVFVTLHQGSENVLSVVGELKEEDAVLYSQEDLTINGEGSLLVETEEGNGILSKDDLVITGGVYQIQVGKTGIRANDSIRIADGVFSITADKDAIHVENKEDETLGYLYIAEGTFDIVSQQDGISASGKIQIDSGTYHIQTGEGTENFVIEESQEGFFRMPGTNTQTEETESQKAVKAGGDLLIQGGTYQLDSFDDALHANGNLTILQGHFDIASTDDGIHADEGIFVEDGELMITKSYEGIEGATISIKGGVIDIISSDDGLNAAGGNDSSGTNRGGFQDAFQTQDGVWIQIESGKLTVNAGGDGIDSNGNLYVKGGTILVKGPLNNGNGALDYNGEGQITGGTLVAVGSSGMAENFGETSTQASILLQTETATTGLFVLTTTEGTEILRFDPQKSYSSVVVSTPQLQVGEEYVLYMGEEEKRVSLDSLIYGEGQGMGRMPGQRDFNKDENRPTPGERPEKPTPPVSTTTKN